MKRRAPHIPLRRPVYVGCEGASEASYANLLRDLLHDAQLPVHLVVQTLGQGAGDPLARIELAAINLAHLRRTRTAPEDRFVLLDFDQAERDPKRADRAQVLAGNHDITILWQRPCFEAVLLRHIEGCNTHRPPDTSTAEKALLRQWPEYAKPMTRAALGKRIDRASVLRAAAVEPGLDIFLRCVGLISTA